MARIDAFRTATPAWDAVSSVTPLPDAIGAFKIDVDADWAVAVRDAAPQVLALYNAVLSVQSRLVAGKAPLKTQRLALLSALAALAT